MSIDFEKELSQLRSRSSGAPPPPIDFEEELARVRGRPVPSRLSLPERIAGLIVRAVGAPQQAVESVLSGLGGARSYEELYRRAGIPESLAGPYSPLVVAPRMVLDPLVAIGGMVTRLRPRGGPAIATTVERGVTVPAVKLGPPSRLPPRPDVSGVLTEEPLPSRFPATPAGAPAPAVPSPTAPFRAGKFGTTADIIRETRGRLGAAETIQRRGVVPDKMVDEFASMVGIRPDELARLQPGQTLSAEHVAQARNILKGSSEKVYSLAQEYTTTKSSETKALLEAAWQQHAQYQLGLSGVATETGRALRQFSRTLREGIPVPITAESIRAVNIDTLARDLLTAGREGAAATLGRLGRPTLYDQIVEIGTAAKVSGPLTQVRNVVGNTTALFFRPAERLAAAGIETVRAGVTGQPRQRFVGEAAADLAGMVTGLKDATRNFTTALLHEGQVLEARTAEMGIRAAGAIPGKAGRVIRLPFRFMNAADAFFNEIGRRGTLYGDAYRQAMQEGLRGTKEISDRVAQLVTNPPPALANRAQQVALEYTFRETLGSIGRTVMRARNVIPGARILFPFFRTPINLVKFSLRRSPLGLATLGGAQGPEVSDRLARVVVGSMVSAATAALAMEGRVSGPGPTDRRIRDVMRANGWQPYSVRVGDTWVSYRGLEPLSAFLAQSASLVEATREEKDFDSLVGRLGKDAGRFLLDATYLTGLKQIWDAVADPTGTTATRMVSGLISGFVPRVLDPVVKFLDPMLREGRTIRQAVQRQIPVLSRGVPERQDILGRPIMPEGGPLRGLFLPVSKEKQDPVLSELARLDLPIPQPGRRVTQAGQRMEVPEQEIRRLKTERGTLLYPILSNIITSSGWADIPDEQKREILEDTMRRVLGKVRPEPGTLEPIGR